MKKKRTLILAFQALLVVIAGIYFFYYTQQEVQPVTVYQFKKNLEINSEVTKGDIEKVSVPAKAVTKEFARKEEDIVGKYVGTKVFAKTYVYSKQLQGKEKIDPFQSMDLSKLRKISLPISYVDGFGGNLKRGDKVDLVFTGEGKKKTEIGDQAFQYSKAFLQDVYVYNVTTSEGYEFIDHSSSELVKDATKPDDGEKIDTSASSDELAVVTLAVTLDQAEEISARMSAGAIRLVSRFEDNESYETLGFVLGDYSKVFSAPANAETGRATINNTK